MSDEVCDTRKIDHLYFYEHNVSVYNVYDIINHSGTYILKLNMETFNYIKNKSTTNVLLRMMI